MRFGVFYDVVEIILNLFNVIICYNSNELNVATLIFVDFFDE